MLDTPAICISNVMSEQIPRSAFPGYRVELLLSKVTLSSMSCLIGWSNGMWVVTISSSVYPICLEEEGCSCVMSEQSYYLLLHSRRYFRKPQHFCAVSWWAVVVPSFTRYVAGHVCSGVLCSGGIPYCLQPTASLQQRVQAK